MIFFLRLKEWFSFRNDSFKNDVPIEMNPSFWNDYDLHFGSRAVSIERSKIETAAEAPSGDAVGKAFGEYAGRKQKNCKREKALGSLGELCLATDMTYFSEMINDTILRNDNPEMIYISEVIPRFKIVLYSRLRRVPTVWCSMNNLLIWRTLNIKRSASKWIY